MIALLLAACSIFDEPKPAPYWYVAEPGYNAQVLFLRVENEGQLALFCPNPQWGRGACALRQKEHCIVVLGPLADNCAIGHEVNGHCKGRDHAPGPVEKQNCGDTP